MSRVSVRYMIDDVPAAMRFYTTLLGFTVEQDASPAFASGRTGRCTPAAQR
jgi:predicted enzyme related to lactoylglutathione lyase